MHHPSPSPNALIIPGPHPVLAVVSLGLLFCLTAQLFAQPAAPRRHDAPTSDPEINRYIAARDLNEMPFPTIHFLVRGGDYQDKVRIGNWAETIYRQVEAELNTKLPFNQASPIRISLEKRPGAPGASPAQSIVQNDLVQRLSINNLKRTDQEDMLESLVFLLCSRLVWQEARRRNGRNGKMVTQAPNMAEWFSTGLAQYMIPGLRNRDRNIVCDAWRDGRSPVIFDLLQHVVFRAGRQNEKASSAFLYAFLKDQPDWTRLVRRLFVVWSEGGDIDYDWLLENMEEIEEELDLEKDWDLFMAWNDGQRKVWNRPMLDQVEQLKALLRFTPRSIGVLGHPRPGQLMTWDDIPEIPRDDPSRQMIISQLQTQLGILGLGQPDHFTNLLGEFNSYLVAVAAEPPKRKIVRSRTPVVENTLAQRLARAERQLALFQLRLEDARSMIDMLRPPTKAQMAALEPDAPTGVIYAIPPGSGGSLSSPAAYGLPPQPGLQGGLGATPLGQPGTAGGPPLGTQPSALGYPQDPIDETLVNEPFFPKVDYSLPGDATPLRGGPGEVGGVGAVGAVGGGVDAPILVDPGNRPSPEAAPFVRDAAPFFPPAGVPPTAPINQTTPQTTPRPDPSPRPSKEDFQNMLRRLESMEADGR